MAEDVKLKRLIGTLEVEKRQWKQQVFNEFYEERRNSHKIKCESVDIKRKEGTNGMKKKGIKMKRRKPSVKLPEIKLDFLTSRLVGGDNETDSKAIIYTSTDCTKPTESEDKAHLGRHRSLPRLNGGFSSIIEEIDPPKPRRPKRRKAEFEPALKLPEVHCPTDSVTVPTKLSTSAPNDPGDNPGGPLGKMKFASVVQKLLNKREDTYSQTANDPVNVEDTPSQEACDEMDGFSKRFSIISSSSRKVKLADLIARLFPKALRMARSVSELERLVDGENEHREENTEKDDHMQVDPVIIVKDCWVGDPKAIASVRRSRLAPDVMGARHKNIGDVMRLIRDLPMYPSCSRNCNRPGVIFDTMVSSNELMIMPSMTKANVKRQLAKSLGNPVVTVAVSGVEDSNKITLLPPITESQFTGLSEDKNMTKNIQKTRPSLRQTIRKDLKKATERDTFTTTQNVIVDSNKSTRFQIGYTYDPVSRLRRELEARKLQQRQKQQQQHQKQQQAQVV